MNSMSRRPLQAAIGDPQCHSGRSDTDSAFSLFKAMCTFRLAILALLPLALAATPASARSFDPIAAYGGSMEFEVLRDGDPVGQQTVFFQPMDGGINTTIEMRLDVKMLGFTVYRFGYRSEALWRDGQLVELNAITDDDGTQTQVSAATRGDWIQVTGPSGDRAAQAGVFPTNHWNPGVVGSRAVLNTITGQIAAVNINAGGREVVQTASGPVEANRFVYSGDLHDVEVWYDAEGRWVRLRFPDKSGGVIDYRCIRCGAFDQ